MNKSKAMILKVDLKNDYDHVNWSFPRLLLLRIGLSIMMTKWIMSCVESINFSVLINGGDSIFFKASRGIRKGCPLSPFLLLLVEDYLTLLVHEAVKEGKIHGLKVTMGST